MEKRFHELEGIIAKAKQQVVQQDEEVNEAEGDTDTDLQIFCVSCSHPVNPKVALRHMERCYAKVSRSEQLSSNVLYKICCNNVLFPCAVREPDLLRLHVSHTHRRVRTTPIPLATSH
uniref:CXXC-type zinc finger protein 1 n=1 Tax=Hucho hucho TaxID=62062 RepID=A0A4W5MU99_9TELE